MFFFCSPFFSLACFVDGILWWFILHSLPPTNPPMNFNQSRSWQYQFIIIVSSMQLILVMVTTFSFLMFIFFLTKHATIWIKLLSKLNSQYQLGIAMQYHHVNCINSSSISNKSKYAIKISFFYLLDNLQSLSWAFLLIS